MNKMNLKSKHVLVGLSGGVDSAASVVLLREQGYTVEGAYLLLREEDHQLEKAREMARLLAIPLHVLDYREYFEETIIRFFMESYRRGQTPNPCVKCNEMIKFGKMLDDALANGFDFLATGHYARIVQENGRSRIYKASNKEKDQSYLLYTLDERQRRHLLLPLGEVVDKQEVHALLQQHGIAYSHLEESQEICFVDKDYRDFLQARGFEPQKGEFVDEEGSVLGAHRGIGFYTIGQRRGLGISASEPLFVKAIDPNSRQIVLGGARSLMNDSLTAEQVHFFEGVPTGEVEAKIRYLATPAPCVISKKDEKILVTFKAPVRAAAPGQSVVFYRGDELLGGGIIC